MDLFKITKDKKTIIFILTALFLGVSWKALALAQSEINCPGLKKQILAAKECSGLYPHFEKLKECYFKDKKFNEFIGFLKSLRRKDCPCFRNYYSALSRYRQLKYLEEAQGWDEYFSKGNAYRDDITIGTQNTIKCANQKDPLHLYARLLLWQFHKDQQDVFTEGALADLMQSASGYAKEAKDVEPLKKVGDTLLAYQEKARSQELYRLYIDKFITAGASEEDLDKLAAGFYKDGNLDLAEAVYDIYLERIKGTNLPKEKIIASLTEIAKQFTYRDEGQNDPAYAEKIFRKLEEIGGKEAFDQELIYLRGFNLEKIKDYGQAKDIYLDLIQRYPQSSYAEETDFKLGIIYLYALRDIQKGKDYFERLAHSATPSANSTAISSLYQLGLINQWQGDLIKAKDYYHQLLERAGDEFAQTKALAGERLKEIDQNKPIEDKLKMFLDASWKEDSPPFNPARLDLKSSLYKPNAGRQVGINSAVYAEGAGCLQPQLTYIWSGELGDALPNSDESGFSTTYSQTGTKIINLLVVSSSGIVDRSFDIVDVK